MVVISWQACDMISNKENNFILFFFEEQSKQGSTVLGSQSIICWITNFFVYKKEFENYIFTRFLFFFFCEK